MKGSCFEQVTDNAQPIGRSLQRLDHSVDVAIEAGTKYLVGHSDAMIGVLVTTKTHYRRVRTTAAILGAVPGPDDCYLALRGIRTLAVRLAQHEKTGMKLAKWLKARKEVARVLHPAFADCPGHRLWKRDFSGASGLFSIVLAKPYSKAALARMLDDPALAEAGRP